MEKLLLLIAAPLLGGLITKIKNNLRMRQGQSLMQPYYNLKKLLLKQRLIPEASSWLFQAAPLVVFSTTLLALWLLPQPNQIRTIGGAGTLLAIFFILSLGRFFLALAALDAGSAFGGMGSSREMFIASFVEPVACLVVFSLALTSGHQLISAFLTGLALLIVILAETSRLPIDNQETHLELTMIHEAMTLDYSGPQLALIELASYIRQIFWLTFLASIFSPSISFSLLIGIIIILAIIIASVEIFSAKFRLFKVPDLLALAFLLALLAIAASLLGG